MNWLDTICATKREDLAGWKATTPLPVLQEQAAARGPVLDFCAALTARPVGLIAEVKRKSPSAGAIREPFDAPAIARAYARGGAQALSVLIDRPYFGGGPEDFAAVRAAVGLPLLYKEFVLDPWQVWHAASLGASAVLLIVAALPPDELGELAAEITAAGMTPLVEVHDEAEAQIAVDADAAVIGINNRNLKTFVTSLETTERVRTVIPSDRLVISESGIRAAADVVRVGRAGARGVLVGEHLLRKDDLAAAVRDLMEDAWTSL
jgi:indole-3-glycerol phosphate synthase